jgi:hypothetical protein
MPEAEERGGSMVGQPDATARAGRSPPEPAGSDAPALAVVVAVAAAELLALAWLMVG